MASRVKQLAGHLIGRKLKNPGAHLFHAADGVADGGQLSDSKRLRMKRALHRERLRPSGMTDDLFGSKEMGGTTDNPYEAEA